MSLTTSRPQFLGIGALKSATTLLYELMKGHPEICLPENLKEVRFFTRYYDRGLPWYEGLFKPTPGQILGEITPDYIFDPDALPRIAQDLPEAKLILILRDPVKRVYSQFTHFRQERRYMGDFTTYLREHPNAVERSRYQLQIERALSFFPRDQLKVLLFEEFVADPGPGMASIFEFLGVDPSYAPERPQAKVNASTIPRFPRIYALGQGTMAFLYDHGLAGVAGTIKKTGVKALMMGRAKDDDPLPPMGEENHRVLVETLSPEVEWVGRFLGRELSSLWTLEAPKG